MPTPLGPVGRLRAKVHHAAFRAKRRAAKQFGDAELWQLRAVERAYRGARGPEVLIIGDSTMYWIGRNESDNRQMAEMIDDGLGSRTRCLTVVGPGYQAGIAIGYLSALRHSRSRPRVVILPVCPFMSTTPWLNHPDYPYQQVAAAMRAAVSGNGARPRRLERPGPEFADAYDRLPAPSFVDAGRTLGEMRMLIHARAETPWQKAVRLRHRMDYYYADTLEPDSPGVRLVADLAEMVVSLELRSVAYISPVNHEDLAESFGSAACSHEARNAEIVATAYRDGVGDLGTLVDPTFDFPRAEFVDPLHPGCDARGEVADRIVEAVRSHMERSGEDSRGDH
jgi:hypothetical protein